MYEVSDDGGFNFIFEEGLLLYWRDAACKKGCSCRTGTLFSLFSLEKIAFLYFFTEGWSFPVLLAFSIINPPSLLPKKVLFVE
jgi:hypothetical protein